MARVYFGDICAYFPAKGGGKAAYTKVGAVFQDTENKSFAIKLDTMPLAHTNWEGWLNIFEKDAGSSPTRRSYKGTDDDDIPF